MNKDYTDLNENTNLPETSENEEPIVMEESVVSEETDMDAEGVETAEKTASEEPAEEGEAVAVGEEAAEALKEAEETVKTSSINRPVPPRPTDPVKKTTTVNTVKKPLISDAGIQRLKGLIFPIAVLLVILLGVVYVINHKSATEVDEEIPIYRYNAEDYPSELILENDQLKLTLDPTTTRFEVLVKSTGAVWHSNPDEATMPQRDNKAQELSTLSIKFGNEITNGLKGALYDNYQYCVEKGNYSIEATKEYIKVNYSIGNIQKQYLLPPVITETNFNALTAKMSDDEIYDMKNYVYKRCDKNKVRDNELEQYKPETLLKKFPIYETEVIYVLKSKDLESNLKLKEDAEAAFIAAGYTKEDYERDCALCAEQEDTNSNKPVNVSVYYRLEGKDLVVEIPFNEIQYDKKSNILTYVTVLPYFGAAGMDENDGYLFVPEGGGGLIKFNNGKTSVASYATKVYGRDRAIVAKTLASDYFANYNTFGILREDRSFICILEDGAAYATINADISGRPRLSYNYVNATYLAAQSEKYELDTSTSSVYVYTALPNEIISQRYRFVDSGKYEDMAKAYRDYLIQNYGDSFTMNSDTEAPVVVEVVTAADKVTQILGVPTSRPLKLTTFKEAKEMMEQLKAEGLNNMSVKLSGWMNGGVNQKILKKVKLVGACGSSGDLKKLTKAAADQGIDLYLDGVTQYAYDSDIFDGFNSFSDSARFISKERAKLYQYSAITYGQREGADTYFLLHAGLAQKMSENLYKAAKKYSANVSFRDTGKDLSADYYKKNLVTRETVRKNQMEQLSKFSKDTKIMINSGNVYAAVYSNMIVNMDLKGAEQNMVDEFIPFYEMVLHGYKNYVGNSINIAKDSDIELLRAAEYGAGLQFTIMKESPFALQKTLYTEYFGASYDSWHEKMVSIYNRYNKEMGHVFNQEMTGHVVLEEGLTCTTYKDGTKVYVNYNHVEKTVGGKKIPARDYLVVR